MQISPCNLGNDKDAGVKLDADHPQRYRPLSKAELLLIAFGSLQ